MRCAVTRGEVQSPGQTSDRPTLYAELFKAFEDVRWNLGADVPWGAFDRS